jgi:hypothetical protein
LETERCLSKEEIRRRKKTARTHARSRAAAGIDELGHACGLEKLRWFDRES